MKALREFAVPFCKKLLSRPSEGVPVSAFELVGWYLLRRDGRRPDRYWANRVYENWTLVEGRDALRKRLRVMDVDDRGLEKLLDSLTQSLLDSPRVSAAIVRDARQAILKHRFGEDGSVWDALTLSELTCGDEAHRRIENAARADGWTESLSPFWNAHDRIVSEVDGHAMMGEEDHVVDCLREFVSLLVTLAFFGEEGNYHRFGELRWIGTVSNGENVHTEAGGDLIRGIRLVAVRPQSRGRAPKPVLDPRDLGFEILGTRAVDPSSITLTDNGPWEGMRFGRDEEWLASSAYLPVLFYSKSVSNRHVRIIRRDGRWLVQDVGSDGYGSLNGTLVVRAATGEPLFLKGGRPVELYDGDLLCLAPHKHRNGSYEPPFEGRVRSFLIRIVDED